MVKYDVEQDLYFLLHICIVLPMHKESEKMRKGRLNKPIEF